MSKPERKSAKPTKATKATKATKTTGTAPRNARVATKAASPAKSGALVSPIGTAGMHSTLGLRIVSIAPKKIVADMPLTSRIRTRWGVANGGAIMAFADLLGAMGTVVNLGPRQRTSTIESKTNFFAGGTGPLLRGVCIPLHIGRTTMVWQTTVTNPDGRMVAIVTQTQMVITDDRAPETALARRRN